jgi:hypothetical protein
MHNFFARRQEYSTEYPTVVWWVQYGEQVCHLRECVPQVLVPICTCTTVELTGRELAHRARAADARGIS